MASKPRGTEGDERSDGGAGEPDGGNGGVVITVSSGDEGVVNGPVGDADGLTLADLPGRIGRVLTGGKRASGGNKRSPGKSRGKSGSGSKPSGAGAAAKPSVPKQSKLAIPGEGIAPLFAVVFGLVAARRGAHWQLAPEEAEQLGEATSALLKHVPAPAKQVGLAVDILAAGVVALAVVGPRISVDAQVIAAKRRGQEAPGAAGYTARQMNGMGTPQPGATGNGVNDRIVGGDLDVQPEFTVIPLTENGARLAADLDAALAAELAAGVYGADTTSQGHDALNVE